MRKNALAMGIAALIGGLGFVGAASAGVIVGSATPTAATLGASDADTLVVSNGGIGHALITPYFNAQNGNATIISLTNTDTNNGKAVKVRFRGASNSDDILDFTVLMSPGDVWNATITASASGVAQITTTDKTCTLPQLAAGVPQSFVTTRLTAKGGNSIANNSREGYVEIFNMADIPKALVYGPLVDSNSALYTAIKHVAGTPPCTSSAVNALLTDFTGEAAAAVKGLATPTAGLFGNWVILNVPQTTTYSGEMVAIRAMNTVVFPNVSGRGNYVLFPQSASGYAANGGVVENVTADPLLRNDSADTMTNVGVFTLAAGTPVIQAAYFDMPDMSTPYTPGAVGNPLFQVANLTGALAVTHIINEYATDASLTAKTDWVFSMPTRRYSVAMDYSPVVSRRLYSLVFDNVHNLPYFNDNNTAINTANSEQICLNADAQTFFDREEGTKTSGAVFSPGNVSITQFCGETSVLSFADSGNSALSASVARQDTGSSAFTNGWGNVSVTNAIGGLNAIGVPIMGASFIKAVNPLVAAGQSGTYGITSSHRFTRP